MNNRIVTDINGRTQVFKSIGTLTNMRTERKVMAVKTAEFVNDMDNYREEIEASSGELKVVELLTEKSIMDGTIHPKMLDALTMIGTSVDNLKAFKSLGFTTDIPELAQLDNIMCIAYTALPSVVNDIWVNANTAFANGDDTNVFVRMLRLGIAISGEKLLSFNKYMTVNDISMDNLSENQLDSLLTDHREVYEEWRLISIEEALCNLMEMPTSTSFVAPVGIKDLFTSIKAVSPSLYDEITNFGEEVDNVNFARTQEFITTIKKMPAAERDGIISIITLFNEKNQAGILNSAGGEPQSIPGVVTVPDVIVGLLLHVGEVILAFDEVVKGTVSELMDSIESEEVKTIINMVATKCEAYDNSVEIGVNIAAMPGKLIPQLMYQDPMMRITGMPELTALINNVGEILFSGFFDAAETEEENDTTEEVTTGRGDTNVR